MKPVKKLVNRVWHGCNILQPGLQSLHAVHTVYLKLVLHSMQIVYVVSDSGLMRRVVKNLGFSSPGITRAKALLEPSFDMISQLPNVKTVKYSKLC